MSGSKNILQNGNSPIKWIIISLAVIFLIYGFSHITLRPITPSTIRDRATTPVSVVQQFYEFEREGDFGSSWELFHPLMKQRFAKQTYIQERAKVFMQDFTVDTFNFTVGGLEMVHQWKMSPDTAPFQEAYRIPVTQKFKSAFGTFTLIQDVYVVDDNGKWRILWAY